mgnify:CR=1 FL=1
MYLKLSQAEQEQYRRDGFIFPVRILDAAETADHRGRLEEIETKYGPMHYRHKPYMLMESAAEIARNPALLDVVEDLLGADILLWDGTYVIKEPRNTKYRSEEHTSELQSLVNLVCRLLLEKKNICHLTRTTSI